MLIKAGLLWCRHCYVWNVLVKQKQLRNLAKYTASVSVQKLVSGVVLPRVHTSEEHSTFLKHESLRRLCPLHQQICKKKLCQFYPVKEKNHRSKVSSLICRAKPGKMTLLVTWLLTQHHCCSKHSALECLFSAAVTLHQYSVYVATKLSMELTGFSTEEPVDQMKRWRWKWSGWMKWVGWSFRNLVVWSFQRPKQS